MKKHKCKGCPDRYLGCHDHCKTYQDIQAENKKEKAAMKGRLDAYRYTMEIRSREADALRKKRLNGRMTYSKKG